MTHTPTIPGPTGDKRRCFQALDEAEMKLCEVIDSLDTLVDALRVVGNSRLSEGLMYHRNTLRSVLRLHREAASDALERLVIEKGAS